MKVSSLPSGKWPKAILHDQVVIDDHMTCKVSSLNSASKATKYSTSQYLEDGMVHHAENASFSLP